MGVLYSRSECRGGFWHVITYDLGFEPMKEVDDMPTEEACEVDLQIGFHETAPGAYLDEADKFLAIHRELLDRPHTAVLISPGGHAVALTHEGGVTVLEHRDASGETLQHTEYGGEAKT